MQQQMNEMKALAAAQMQQQVDEMKALAAVQLERDRQTALKIEQLQGLQRKGPPPTIGLPCRASNIVDLSEVQQGKDERLRES
eukprot:gene14197-62427_t